MTPPRLATVVIIDPAGEPVGSVGPFRTVLPYWQEVEALVEAVAARCGLTVWVLRMLHAELPAAPGGAVTYLAEATSPLPGGVRLDPIAAADLARLADDSSHRAAYARLGGPAASVAWAERILREPGRADGQRGTGGLSGRHPVAHPGVGTDAGRPSDDVGAPGTVAQTRTWNLSAIWRLESAGERMWLKQVPAFFGHEAMVLRLLGEVAPGLAVALIAHDPDGHRLLLADQPGVDGYDAAIAERIALLDVWVPVQQRLAGDLLSAGTQATTSDPSGDDTRAVAPPDVSVDMSAGCLADVPVRHGAELVAWITEAIAPHVARVGLSALIARIAPLVEELEAGGLPVTLVHGDLHMGNTRLRPGQPPVLLDFGDSFIGHPGFDLIRLADGLAPPDAHRLREHWVASWKRLRPTSDPDQALDVIEPLAALRNAAVFASFLARIEPTEHPYHALDVPFWLAEAARLLHLDIVIEEPTDG